MPDISTQIWSIHHEQEEQKTQELAQSLRLSYVDLVNYPFAPDAILVLPKTEIEKHQFIAYLRVGKIVKVASVGAPTVQQKNLLIKYFPNFEFNFSICSQTGFKFALSQYDRLVELATTQKKIQEKKRGAEFVKIIRNIRDIALHIKKVSTTELLDLTLNGAVITRASDIHLEPTETDCRLRFRIDGVLQDVARLTLEQYKALNSRIKNLAGLKLDIAAKPQDGRFDYIASDHRVDLRVSSMPGSGGEIIVMRLLLSDNPLLTLSQLGLNKEVSALTKEAISKPHGLILNTGPTGSGKTTTLYAILNEINKPEIKIITIEDPIEYQITGINQTQVDKIAGYTFANALASAVRQDPDVIMVGEIRDPETAKIALQAGMTGHLVLSTLHTNTASGAIPRLLDMGIEPYLLAGSINLILAQRLVRKLCSACKGKGCDECQKSGFLGRLIIAEALKPTSEFNELIMRKASVEEFEQKAKALGMKTMSDDGLEKAKLGLTTREEVERVTRE
ncbi:MAG: Uncharacterized protein CEN89_156 [Candidatus Berkelbacteria bacterium Licking1014_7]|uniref:Bacterial type II secretion system protein E domain-containing protein n=1 Tax=Candidatus Berkelbacteria bacterium Licking1014_7 TaxID=2017147 RepID=A0A554LK67_9BACT|nr:MAG: Uncharacterized protein CEN89_156 [Candidatus Berkelbacteria bacterium Licking1014_7]